MKVAYEKEFLFLRLFCPCSNFPFALLEFDNLSKWGNIWLYCFHCGTTNMFPS